VHKRIAVLICGGLILLSAFLLWLRPQPQTPPQKEEPQSWQAELPSLQLVSPTGDVKWQLTAEKIQFAEDGKTAEVLGLRGRLAAEDEEIAVEAPKASIDWQRQDITFTGPVKVRSRELSIVAGSLSWHAQAQELVGQGGVEVTTKTTRLLGEKLTWQQPQGKLVVEGGVQLWATTGAGR
jgi:lipopolysaccharide assembly outer membrane protein LptD (OstA)